MTSKPPKEVADYLAALTPEARGVVEEMRRHVLAVAPDAIESISYGIPTFKVGGKILVHVAGWQEHVSMYPVPPTDDPQLLADIERYRVSKGTLKFPLKDAIPYDVVDRVAQAHLARLGQ